MGNEKNWVGNKNSIFKTLGASNHVKEDRQKEDYYATEPRATELLLGVEEFIDIWEPACGEGHISKVLEKHGYNVKSTDLVDRGYGSIQDFLFFNDGFWGGDIITNPPYRLALEFVEKSIDIINTGRKVAMFLKLQFLEGKARKVLFNKYPPRTIYVSSSRLACAKNGEFNNKTSKAIAYAWFVWGKGHKGETIVKWIN